MSLRVVTMAELRLEVLLEPERTGDSVAEVCRRRGISRETFYEYKRRYEAEGVLGLEPRPRRPVRSPRQVDADLEVEICQMRKEHKRWGARRIRAELGRAGTDPPATSTIHQVLRRNHLVADQPRKRPKARRRFEREVPNDLWQIDATRVHLEGGNEAWIVDALDDHARFLLAARACLGPTGEAAWSCFETASSRYGLPRQLLSDNGLCFTGRLHRVVVEFERRVRSLGVLLINSRPEHPQTLGKLERFHKTLKEWLADEGPPRDLAHLQELLDRFRAHYNDDRPHQGISDATPAERYRPGPGGIVPTDALAEPHYPPGAILRKVWGHGVVTYDKRTIGLGMRWSGLTVRIVPAGELIHVYYGNVLVRSLAFDPARRHQPLPRTHRGVVATS
ncbi:MAG: IS481 family transposase [Actinomycetota bacterium]